MADSYTQLTIQLVFVVKYREAKISPLWEGQLYRYIIGFLHQTKHQILAVNGMPDHIHILFGLDPAVALSDLVRELKKATTAFIQNKGFCVSKFQWQAGYGGFSYSKWDREKLIQYVLNQKEHHQQQGFREEYLKILKEEEIDFKEAYLFDFLED